MFTRFITPPTPEQAQGQWRQYYRHWHKVTLAEMDPALLDLVAPLAKHAQPETILDKPSHGGFESPIFIEALARRKASALVLTGVETEVCVLAFAFAATDRGYRVVIVEDAVTSSSPAGHRAALAAIYPRLDQQIQIATVDQVLAAWPGGRVMARRRFRCRVPGTAGTPIIPRRCAICRLDWSFALALTLRAAMPSPIFRRGRRA